MADIEQTQHIWLECRQVGFWCRCTCFGFLGPN